MSNDGDDVELTLDSEVEKTVSFRVVVATMQEALGFVMDHLDQVGPDPTIDVHPVFGVSPGDVGIRWFEGNITGTVPAEPVIDGLEVQ